MAALPGWTDRLISVVINATYMIANISRCPLCATKDDVMRDVSPSKKQPAKTVVYRIIFLIKALHFMNVAKINQFIQVYHRLFYLQYFRL